MAKRRLKQGDLVTSILRIFADEFERSDAKSIHEITLPIEKVKSLLHEGQRISYRSGHWIHTQLKRYEEELGFRLFRKEKNGSGGNDFSLTLYDDLRTFTQKRHLYISGKIKIANGLVDIIHNHLAGSVMRRELKVLLGAGSSIYHTADAIAVFFKDSGYRMRVFTHNIGVIERLTAPDVDNSKIELFTPSGRIDPITYCIVTANTEFYTNVDFDFIVQGTSVVNDGRLYVESDSEIALKSEILHRCRGHHILILTKHECRDEPLDNQSYGSITDYDSIIVPRFHMQGSGKKNYEAGFDRYRNMLHPMILNWNYEILSTAG